MTTSSDTVQGNKTSLTQLADIAIARCQPRSVLPAYLPSTAPRGRNIVLGAGKAAAEMAAVAHAYLVGPTEGLVVTRYGHGPRSTTGQIEVIEAGHPVPDEKSEEAALAMLVLADSAGPNDRVYFLLSGGGSALLSAPIDGVSSCEKRQITRALLARGASIREINSIRKHLSKVKGGRLAARAAPADLDPYIISDVVGDDPSVGASGPSISADGSVDNALHILKHYDIDVTQEIVAAMNRNNSAPVTTHPIRVVATAATALSAVVDELKRLDWQVQNIGSDLEGDASDIGRDHAELARFQLEGDQRVALVSGGELTVTLSNDAGSGGPNLEYLTSLMIHLDGVPGIEAIACDTDGIDGSEDNAGGYISTTSIARAEALEIRPADSLANNTTYELFKALDDLIVTGPTRTNVNDLRIILVDPTVRIPAE